MSNPISPDSGAAVDQSTIKRGRPTINNVPMTAVQRKQRQRQHRRELLGLLKKSQEAETDSSKRLSPDQKKILKRFGIGGDKARGGSAQTAVTINDDFDRRIIEETGETYIQHGKCGRVGVPPDSYESPGTSQPKTSDYNAPFPQRCAQERFRQDAAAYLTPSSQSEFRWNGQEFVCVAEQTFCNTCRQLVPSTFRCDICRRQFWSLTAGLTHLVDALNDPPHQRRILHGSDKSRLHSCIAQEYAALGITEPPARKCRCRKLIEFDEAAKMVETGDAMWAYTLDGYSRDIVRVSRTSADKKYRPALATKTPRVATIEEQHLRRAYIEEFEEARDRIEEYGRLILDARAYSTPSSCCHGSDKILNGKKVPIRCDRCSQPDGERLQGIKPEPADDPKTGSGRQYDFGRGILQKPSGQAELGVTKIKHPDADVFVQQADITGLTDWQYRLSDVQQ